MSDQRPPLLPPHPQPLLLEKPQRKSYLGLIALLVFALFAALAIWGIMSRISSEHKLKKYTRDAAIETVSVVTAREGAETEDVVLPGTVQAWHEAIIYARTPGYLKSWATDIGSKVKQGDVLAEIDAPDLDAQFRQAQADLNTAIANNNIAQITAKRYVTLLKSDSVSRQQADTQIATAQADRAMAASSQANLDHLQQEEDFKSVVAPFDGTITARNIDVGALINGTNSGTVTANASMPTGQDMFHIAETDRLRVYIQVPESDANAVKPDLKAELHVPQYPDRVFPARLSSTANAIDPTTRTLLAQLEVDNNDGALLAGSYADVHLKIPAPTRTIILPVNALLFRNGMQAGIVDNNHVTLKTVKIGRDYGKTVEIVDGLSPGDQIVINPPDSLEDGQQVKIAPPDQKTSGNASGDPKNKNKNGGQSRSTDEQKTQSTYQSTGPDALKQTPSNDETAGQSQTKQSSGANDKKDPGQSQNAADPNGTGPMSDQQKPNATNTK